ncbi:MAG TPA: 2-oxoacid:acceptor oxidoreductase subunit alpha [Desulfobacteraceae bacterium]|nr:2-oxoacid:acceptor oxidoreductase subunit alpha [Desulfobacteraceae bacterium]HPJ68683.1 2-oxoacid:acceptor oxidoreductase subunit alpha [Desulfobacteraceae bacterium]HPQ29004.1 2-oxoacid:acceptor oxidoreductase subunit alpha [Desulfobacteraceae bacterium]
MAVDITIRIGGRAGQGMQSIGVLLGKIFTRHGYYVFVRQDVESRIRGGHSYVQVRIKDEPVFCHSDKVDILIALDKGSMYLDQPDLAPDDIMIFDVIEKEFTSDNPARLPIPMEELAVENGKNKIMANSVATGAALALLGCELQPILDRLDEEFSARGKEIVEKNRNCVIAGYRYIQNNFKGTFPKKIPLAPYKKEKLFITGSQAIALGAVCSGLKFYSGYPMSPSTPIMESVAAMSRRRGIIVEPAEDEIAAINMVIGASFAGVRSMTATSGGGFCLMVEGLGLAGMTETPAVIVVAQRPGPSTGLPTRTEQADLDFVIHASHGEFPRAVFAPGHAEQAFYTMSKAFNIADRFQTPVIVLGDQHLNDSYFTVDNLDLGRITIDRGNIVNAEDMTSSLEYKRYAWDEAGVSPRILPGQTKAVVYADSDEHNESGHITESATDRKEMVVKRLRKFDGIQNEMNPPEVYGEPEPDLLLLGWGSTYGALREAADILTQNGLKTEVWHFCDVFPFPDMNLLARLPEKTRIISVENNSTGQFARTLMGQGKIPIDHQVFKFDGRPYSPKDVVTRVHRSL